ncbi:MAG TPA: VWA domain-containing protein [Terriglobales bacterium]|nr:VWA domain-containing protein [Terriglobales bacterium]
MRRLSVVFLLVGTLAIYTVAQDAPAPQTAAPAAPASQAAAPAAAPAAAVSVTTAPAPKPAPLPSFSSPVVPPPQKTTETAKAADDDPEAIATFRKRVDEVNVIFTVTDKHGHFIKDLKKDDIRVLDDHKPPSSVVAFRSETDLPLRVGLLIDASNSIRDRFRFEQEAAMNFLSQIVRPNSDLAFVLGFDTTSEITQDFTDSAEKLAHGVRMLRPGGGTAMYDAIYYACRDKLMKAPASGPVRRAIILVSDGEDNQSRVTMGETIEMAQRAEVILYAISTNTSNIKMRGDKVMEKMAEATGGRAFFPFKIEDVTNAFTEIQDELRSQYAVAYKPADFLADGRYRSIDISADNKRYHVRARKGYYAPTQ